MDNTTRAEMVVDGNGQWDNGSSGLSRRWRSMGEGGPAVGGGGKWVLDQNLLLVAERRQVAIAHHCILCHLTPCLLCCLCRQWRQRRMTTRQRARRPLAGNVNVDGGGDKEGGSQPITTVTNIFPPTAPPSTISVSFSPGLSTADVVTTVGITDDCGQWTTGLQRWAAAAKASRGRCVWWEVWWEV